MNRRNFLKFIGISAIAIPGIGLAQKPPVLIPFGEPEKQEYIIKLCSDDVSWREVRAFLREYYFPPEVIKCAYRDGNSTKLLGFKIYEICEPIKDIPAIAVYVCTNSEAEIEAYFESERRYE